MKWLKDFETHSDYEAYITGSSVAYPNVSVCNDDYVVHYNDVGEIIDPDTPQPTGYSTQYFTLEALENGTFTFNGTTGVSVSNTLSYSLDNGSTWTALSSEGTTPTVSAGSKIMFKGTCLPYDEQMTASNTFKGIGNFVSTGRFNVEGNAMSLLYGDNFSGQTSLAGKQFAFYNLFNYNTNLVSAENLVLPATTLANSCYHYMFIGCSSLTTAPELPATTLVDNCYDNMFAYCSSLNYIKCLATDISAEYCTNYWVQSVAASGTFVKNASMSSWTTGVDGIPTNWTVQDA